MSAAQRRKGADFERELCGILSQELGRVIKRNLSQVRDSGADILDVGKFVIEAKRRADIAVYEWYGQCQKAAMTPGQIPVVIMRADGEQPLALLSLVDFIPLMRGEL